MLSALLAGCGDDGDSPPDPPATSDAGPRTASDAGPPGTDGGPPDEPTPDAGPPAAADAGAPDAGPHTTDPACAAPELAPGDHAIEIEHRGATRRYVVHVPASVDGRVPVPLVLDFHGLASDPGQQILLSGMNDKADAEGFVAVHPEGIGLLRSWNGGACCGRAIGDDSDDVGLARAIVEDVSRKLCVDPRRVYATGMSNGGFMSYRLACELSDVIAAVAPVAGVLGVPDEACAPGRPVPVMHFHGTADGTVPFEGSALLGFRSVRDTIDSWVTRDGCDATPSETLAEGRTRCETYGGCDGGAEVTLCTIDGGAHWWPGGPLSFDTVSATDAMWEFFARHPMP